MAAAETPQTLTPIEEIDALIGRLSVGDLDLTDPSVTESLVVNGNTANRILTAADRPGTNLLLWAGRITTDWELPETVEAHVAISGSVGGHLGIYGSVDGDLRIDGSGSVGGNLAVYGSVVGDLTISGSVGRGLDIDGLGSIGQHLNIDGSVDGELSISGSASVGGNLNIDGSVGGDLGIYGSASVGGNLRISGSGSVDGLLGIGGSVDGNLTIWGLVRDLGISGSVGADLGIYGSASVGGNLAIDGSASVGGDLAIDGSASVGGDLAIFGSVGENLIIFGSVGGKAVVTPGGVLVLGSVRGARFGAEAYVGDRVRIDSCDFRQCPDLDKLLLVGTDLFPRPSWRSVERWRGPRLVAPEGATDAEMASVYRGLRTNLEGRSNRPGAAVFYRGEMRSRFWAALKAGRLLEAFVIGLYWLMSGFGLNPWRPVVFFIALATAATQGFLGDNALGGTTGLEWIDVFQYSVRSMVSFISPPDPPASGVLDRNELWLQLGLRFLGPLLFAQFVLAVRDRVAR